MRKILLSILIVATLLSSVVVAYYAATYRPVSTLLKDAGAARAKGDVRSAENLLLAAIKKDPASEDGYAMLAAILESDGRYAGAAVCWEKAQGLNPLSAEYPEKMFEAISASGIGNARLTQAYESVSARKKLSDRVRCMAAEAYAARGDNARYDEILSGLESEKSPYAELLKAHALLLDGKTAEAADAFSKTAAKAKAPELSNMAALGAARSLYAGGNPAGAAEVLGGIKNASPSLEADVKLLNYAISMGEGDAKTALENLAAARKTRRESVALALDCAELAFSEGRPEIISEIRKDLAPGTREGLMLDYYYAALENASKGENKAALKSLRMSGTLLKRPAAKILEFHLACRLGLADDAAEISEDMPPSTPKNLRDAYAAEMAALLEECEKKRDYAGAEKLSEAVLKLSPENPAALRRAVNSRLSKGELSSALSLAQKLDTVMPGDRQAYETRLLALNALNRHAETLQIAETRMKASGPDSFSAVFAARASGALGDMAKATGYYMEAAKDPNLPEAVLLEAGRHIVANADEKDFEGFVSRIAPGGSGAERESMALSFRSRFWAARGDLEKARGFMARAIEASPKSEAAYAEAAYLEYSSGGAAQARNFLETGLKEIPGSYALKLRLAMLLSESDAPEAQKRCRSLLESQAPRADDAGYVYAALSKACAALGDRDAAMDYAQKAEAADPKNPAALLEFGLRLSERGQYERAMSAFMKMDGISANERARSALLASFAKACENSGAARRVELAESVLKALPGCAEAEGAMAAAKKELSTGE